MKSSNWEGKRTITGIQANDIAVIMTPSCPFKSIASEAQKATIMDTTEKKSAMRPKSNLSGKDLRKSFSA
jgi:hypothetical protein